MSQTIEEALARAAASEQQLAEAEVRLRTHSRAQRVPRAQRGATVYDLVLTLCVTPTHALDVDAGTTLSSPGEAGESQCESCQQCGTLGFHYPGSVLTNAH